MTTILVQLGKTADNVATAEDSLETLPTKKDAKEAGIDDPENPDWLQNIELKIKK